MYATVIDVRNARVGRGEGRGSNLFVVDFGEVRGSGFALLLPVRYSYPAWAIWQQQQQY